MERINVIVSDEAKDNLRIHKRTLGYNSLDNTLDDILKRYLTGEEQQLVFQALDAPVQSEDDDVRRLAERIIGKLKWKGIMAEEGAK